MNEDVTEPRVIEEGAITRGFKEGSRYKDTCMDMIGKARVAEYKIPPDKAGIVLGSGKNTEKFRKKVGKHLTIIHISELTIQKMQTCLKKSFLMIAKTLCSQNTYQ